MSVRFVVGRAGSGKTWRCLEAIRERLRGDPAEGHRLLLLVPEQATFQMERALIETPDIAGFIRCEVLSFNRLAYRILAETGADPRRGDETIGKMGRMMAMRRLIRRAKGELQIFDRVADRPGLVKQVSTAVEELMRERIDPQVLAELAERRSFEDPLGAARVADLGLLYQSYLDYLEGDRLDPAQYLALAARRLASCAWSRDSEVWVDGFAGFTAQELDLLIELARVANKVEIALLMDPTASTVEADKLPPLSFSLFARTERTLVRLRNQLLAAGIPVEAPDRLTGHGGSRFQVPELAQLESHLFGSAPSPSSAVASPAAVRVLELPSRRLEVEAAVAEIQRLTRESRPPMRHRDIAVIVRDMEPYHDLLSAALKAHGIPYFIDRRQPTTHHPLIEMVRGMLAIATDDCRLESVRLTLKTGLLPVSADDADLLENYLLAHGIAGRSKWNEPWTFTRIFRHKGESNQLSDSQKGVLDRVNRIRREYLAVMTPWLDAVSIGATKEGRAWASELYDCLERNHVPETLHQWADHAEQDGATDEAQTHRQVWSDFVDLLDEFVKALDTEQMGIREFRETIEAGLAEFDLGLAPPSLDQVLIGAIERSRQPAVRAVIVLGFDQTQFPSRRAENPLLGDEERDALELVGAEIGPSRRRQILDERMLAYIALTRPSEQLWLSYPQSDVEGQPIGPSPFLDQVLGALPGVKVERVGDPRQERKPAWITRVSELGGRLAMEMRYRPCEHSKDRSDRRHLWNALYEQSRIRPEWRHTLARTLAGLAYRNEAKLATGMIDCAYKIPFTASVSRLERFAACPFAHYAEYWLKLDPRVEADLATADVGTLCHAILEKFIDQLARNDLRLGDLQDDEIVERLDAVADEVLPQLANEMLLTEARHAYLADRYRGYLARVARWQRDAAAAGRFRPRAVEFPFGYRDGSGGPLTLKTPAGRVIQLRGRIDRVDVAELGDQLLGMVIDYKTTTGRKLNYSEIYHGLTLQLVGYMLALERTGYSLAGRPILPVAALYLPLIEKYQVVEHPDQEKRKTYQWQGVVDLSALDSIDGTARAQGGSRFLAARIKQDGRPYLNSDLAAADQMKILMRFVGWRMGKLADDMLEGGIAVKPYRLGKKTPCHFCKYLSVCRYEVCLQPPNTLPTFKKVDAFLAMEKELGHA